MMRSRMKLTGSLLVFCVTISAFSQKVNPNQQETQQLADNVFNLSEVMLHDVTNPPAASRVYAYSLLGAYEVAFLSNLKLPNINGKLKVIPNVLAPPLPKKFNLSFSASYALLQVGMQLMPSGSMLEKNQVKLVEQFRKSKKLSRQDIEENIVYATEIAKQVVQYARADSYNKLSTYSRYTPRKGEGYWYPTPPEYMAPVEPQWKTVRPFFLDSASQFAPAPPVPFSKDSASLFHKQMKEVYNAVKNPTDEQRKIASFWDCNPFAVTYSGHLAIGMKKISPGGHWMGITGIVCKKAGISLDSAIFVHALTALALHDAFISCWQEKYFSNRIRPETAINKSIDPSWRPLLQTPPFPEYTSGHSVASASAAAVLTYLLGDNFSFIDTSEIYFGIPERHFDSFYQAADEAAVSRLYGGIHFRDAIEEGSAQGKKVGKLVVTKIQQ